MVSLALQWDLHLRGLVGLSVSQEVSLRPLAVRTAFGGDLMPLRTPTQRTSKHFIENPVIISRISHDKIQNLSLNPNTAHRSQKGPGANVAGIAHLLDVFLGSIQGFCLAVETQ